MVLVSLSLASEKVHSGPGSNSKFWSRFHFVEPTQTLISFLGRVHTVEINDYSGFTMT
jgi:hypothetical protein